MPLESRRSPDPLNDINESLLDAAPEKDPEGKPVPEWYDSNLESLSGVEFSLGPNGAFTGLSATGDGVYKPETDSTDLLADLHYRFDFIDPIAFISSFPYEFVIWDASGGMQTIIAKIILPIAPQRITVNTATATNLTATMKGLVEDNNGAPFRRINVSGTSGVNWENAMSEQIQGQSKGVLEYAFQNTIKAAQGLADSVTRAVSAFEGPQLRPTNNPQINNQVKASKEDKSLTGQVSEFLADPIGGITDAFGESGSSDGKDSSSVSDFPALFNTGYLFFHNLARFFDYYIAQKKVKGGNNVRLTFQMHKDKMYYDCILNNFNFSKPPGTLEYMYNIQLTSYRRRSQPVGNAYKKINNYPATAPGDINWLANVFNGLDQLANTLDALSNILQGFQNDFHDIILRPIKQLKLLYKKALNFGEDVSDFRDWLGKDKIGPFFAKALASSDPDKFKAATADSTDSLSSDIASLINLMRNIRVPSFSINIDLSGLTPEEERALSQAQEASGESPDEDLLTDAAGIMDNMTPEDIDGISIDQLELPQEILDAFDRYADYVANKPKDAWAKERQKIAAYMLIAEKLLGLELIDEQASGLQVIQNSDGTITVVVADTETGEAIIDSITGEYIEVATAGGLIDPFPLAEEDPALVSQILSGAFDIEETESEETAGDGVETGTQVTPETIEILNVINETLFQMDTFIASYETWQQKKDTDYAAYYTDYAVAGGIDMNTNQSKFYVPYPLGSSLQALAVQYLGDADRWVEIQAINYLQEPYIDEVGFKKYFTASGSGNTITLADAEGLIVGQIITLGKESVDYYKEEERRIEEIETVNQSITFLTLSGDPDLAKYTVSDNSYLHAYRNNTVNSKKLIAIPSSAPSSKDKNPFKKAPNQEDLSFIAKISQTDWLVNSEGDLALEGGDVRLSFGLQNLVQAALIKLYTPIRSLVHDPTFGNPLTAGLSVADINSSQIIKKVSQMFAQDSRYGSITAARLNVRGGAALLDIAVGVKGTDYYLPLSTELPV